MRICFLDNKPKTIIPDLANKIFNEEASGILNWALEGLCELFKDIETHGDIYLSDKQRGINSILLDDTYHMKEFIKNNIIYDENTDLTIEEINSKLEENNIQVTITNTKLTSIITQYFPDISRSNSIKRNDKCYVGFRNITFK